MRGASYWREGGEEKTKRKNSPRSFTEKREITKPVDSFMLFL